MAEESEEIRRLREALGIQADVVEEELRQRQDELRIRHGITAKLDVHGTVEAGTLKGLESSGAKRGKLENQINSELERILGKDQALHNRKQVLYEKELENYGYFIDDQYNLTKILSKQNVDLDKEQKKVLDRLRKEGIDEERVKAKKAEVQKAQDDIGSNLSKGLGELTKGIGNFAMGLAAGNTNFTSLNPLIDIVANSLASLAKAIPFVGEAIAGVTKAAAEGAKFVLELMDRNLKAFQELGNAGALVADGMAGVSRQFLESGMSLEGFKKAIKDNSGDLAQWGKTVGAGSERFTKAVGMLTKGDGPLAQAGLELRKLGMTADDIGTASAGFLQQELKLGRARNMTEEQLAKGTAKYAQELDALQKVTGLSREDLIKQRNEQLADSRFSASMDVIAEENAAGAEAIKQFALTIKDPELKRGFMDLTSGANTDAAKKALRVMGDTVPDVIDKLKNSKPEELAKNFDLAQTMMKKGAKQAIDTFGKETFALMPDTKVLGSYSSLRDIQNQNNVSLEEAIAIQDKQKKAAGDLTENTVQAQQNMERMGQEVFKMGLQAMPMASKAVNAFTKSMVELMKHINKILGKSDDGGLSNDVEDTKALLKQQEVMDENIDAQKELKDAVLLLKKAQTDPNKSDKEKAELQKAVDIAKEKANKTQLEEEEFNKQSQIAMAKKMERQLAMQNELRVINKERRAKGEEAYLDVDQAKAGGHTFKAETKDAVPAPAKGPSAPAPREAAPPNAGAARMGDMATQRRSGLDNASRGIPSQPVTSTPQPYNAARDSQLASEPPTPGPGVKVATTSRGLPATQSADDVMKLIKFQGDALGTISHFDALDPYVKRTFMDMIAEYGKPVQVNAAMRDMDEQKTLYDKWISNGKVGNPVAKPGDSKHNFGRALDLNSNQVTELKSSGLLSKYGFNTIDKDPPHIEMARFGGVFNGPNSGYDVELHGREAIIPLPDPKSIISVTSENVKKDPLAKVMKSPEPKSMVNINENVKKDPLTEVMKSPDPKSMVNINENVKKDPLTNKPTDSIVKLPDPNSMISIIENVKKDQLTEVMNNQSNITLSGMDQLTDITQLMMQMMEDKFDEMISKLSTGNDIQDKLLRNTMV